MPELDAVVVGSGPNGLAAAVILARAGLRVTLFEAASMVGGAARTMESTLPGFLHDVGSAVHPMALASPFFRAFGLAERIDLVIPPASYGHPLDGEPAAIAYRDLGRTAEELGVDGPAWRALLGPLAARARAVSEISGTSLVRLPRHPLLLARLGMRVLEQGGAAWSVRFREPAAPALLTGVMAHANRPLPDIAAAAAGLVLAAHGHAAGWPIPVGGSQSIASALADDFRMHGGTIVTDAPITALAELPRASAVVLDVTPRALARLAGDALSTASRRSLERFRYGNAVAKVDFALSGPVPWSDPRLAEAGTIHLGGSRHELRFAEAAAARGRIAERPYVLVSQPSLFDASRAPAGAHVLWAYTHVPAGSTADVTSAIVAQLERSAPGFRDLVLASAHTSAVDLERIDPNLVGGDIGSGAVSLAQLLRRPRLVDPWRTDLAGVYLASASTAPGPGVHGMGGMNAARIVLAREFGIGELPSLAPPAPPGRD